MNDTETIIEAVLFYRGEPITVAELARIAKTTEPAIHEALASLATALAERGIRLIREGKYASLATAPEAAPTIEALRREELEGPLGKAGLETLSVIIFNGPVSRADIEYVRGVNCSSILRSLTMRGLVERIENPKDKRGYLYQTTPELPAALGVASTKDIPGYAEMRASIDAVVALRETEKPELNDSN